MDTKRIRNLGFQRMANARKSAKLIPSTMPAIVMESTWPVEVGVSMGATVDVAVGDAAELAVDVISTLTTV